VKTFPLDPKVQRDLAELLRELEKATTRYVVVGAWAVMAHTSRPRATKDIDVYVSANEENLRKVARVLKEFGAPATVSSIEALRPAPDVSFAGVTFGHPPNRVDVLTRMSVSFDEVEGRFDEFDMAGARVRVASRSDLIEMKRVAFEHDPSRKTDRLDLDALEGRTRLRPR